MDDSRGDVTRFKGVYLITPNQPDTEKELKLTENLQCETDKEIEFLKNNLADLLTRWHQREGRELARTKTEQSFTVKREEIAAADYDLSLNRYKEVVNEHVEHTPPLQLIAELQAIEADIQAGLKQLEGMLK